MKKKEQIKMLKRKIVRIEESAATITELGYGFIEDINKLHTTIRSLEKENAELKTQLNPKRMSPAPYEVTCDVAQEPAWDIKYPKPI